MLAAALAAAIVAGVFVGSVPVAAADVVAALFGDARGADATIVRDLRLPRVLAAALVGGALAAAGALLQGLLRNPLGDPYVTGTSAGATLGAVAALSFGAGTSALVPVAAFAGALAAVLLVWRLAAIGGRVTVLTVLLAGVVFTAFTSAVVTFLLVASDRLVLGFRAVLGWLGGGVSVRSNTELAAAAAIVTVGLAVALVIAPRLDAFVFGEETAATLGVDPLRTTNIVLAATALLTGAAVALGGLIGFVGLVVPHALRLVVGPPHRRLIATSALGGATALVVADLFARVVLAPAELPVGVITGLIGGPFFLALLARSRSAAI